MSGALICFAPFIAAWLFVFGLWVLGHVRRFARRELLGPLHDPEKTWPGGDR